MANRYPGFRECDTASTRVTQVLIQPLLVLLAKGVFAVLVADAVVVVFEAVLVNQVETLLRILLAQVRAAHPQLLRRVHQSAILRILLPKKRTKVMRVRESAYSKSVLTLVFVIHK